MTNVSIFVLPSEENLPPRALLMKMDESFEELTERLEAEGATEAELAGTLAVWTADMGCWTVGGMPLPGDLSEAITEHAKDLGVDWG